MKSQQPPLLSTFRFVHQKTQDRLADVTATCSLVYKLGRGWCCRSSATWRWDVAEVLPDVANERSAKQSSNWWGVRLMNLLIMHSSPVTPSPFTPTPKTAKNTVVCFSLSRSSQRICACKRLSVTFRNTMILYGLRCLINPSPICHVAGPLLSGCPPLRTLRSLPATYFPHFFFIMISQK